MEDTGFRAPLEGWARLPGVLGGPAITTPTLNVHHAMRPRTILYTGKGGVGKTSVAAATARRCAAAGHRTLVFSTDPAHSLADALQTPLGGEPSEVADGLFAQQVSAQDELERNWSSVQDWAGVAKDLVNLGFTPEGEFAPREYFRFRV